MFWGQKITQASPYQFKEGTTSKIAIKIISAPRDKLSKPAAVYLQTDSLPNPTLLAVLTKQNNVHTTELCVQMREQVKISTDSQTEVHLVGNFYPTQLQIESSEPGDDESIDDSQISSDFSQEDIKKKKTKPSKATEEQSDDAELDPIRKNPRKQHKK